MSSPMLPRANELPFKAEFVITKHALPSVSYTPTFNADLQRAWWVKSCHFKRFLPKIICFFCRGIQWYIYIYIYMVYENYLRKLINSRFHSRHWFLIEKNKTREWKYIFYIYIKTNLNLFLMLRSSPERRQ